MAHNRLPGRIIDLETSVKRIENKLNFLKELLGSKPWEKNEAGITPETTSDQENHSTHRQMSLKPEIPPAPPNSQQPNNPWYKTLRGWNVFFQMIGIPFAILYAIVTTVQWWQQRHNFSIEERAWIEYVKQPDVPGGNIRNVSFPEGQEISFPFGMKNIGKTPALNVKIEFFLDIFDFDKEPPLGQVDDISRYHHEVIFSSILFPDQPLEEVRVTRHGGDMSTVRKITHDEASGMNEGKKYFAIYGIANYEDIFGKPHWTRFCESLSKPGYNYTTYSCVAFNRTDNE